MYLGKGQLLPTFPFFDPDPDDLGVTITWSRGGTSPIITKRLDKRFTWSGSNADTVGWFGRWGEGNGAAASAELAGHHPTTYGSHGGTDSGEAFAILQAAIQENFGVFVLPPAQAVVDFGLVNSEDGRPLDVTYWMKLLGRESPISQVPRPPRPRPDRPPVAGPITPTPPPTSPAPPVVPVTPAPPTPTRPRIIPIDFRCTPTNPSFFLDLPPGTTQIDGDLVIVASEDPREVLRRHFIDPGSDTSLLDISNLRVSLFALRGNNTGTDKKPKRVLRWGFTQGAQGQARVEGDITAKGGQMGGPKLDLPGVHRVRFTHVTSTGVTTFLIGEGKGAMRVVSRETGPLNSARFWLGTAIPDPSKASYIPPVGRITGSLTINGAGTGTGTGPGTEPIAPTPIPTPPPPPPQPPSPPTGFDLVIAMVKEIRAKARDLDSTAEALLKMMEKS